MCCCDWVGASNPRSLDFCAAAFKTLSTASNLSRLSRTGSPFSLNNCFPFAAYDGFGSKAEVVADQRAAAGLAADGFTLEQERGQPLG